MKLRGLALVELLLVVVILATLAVIAVPRFQEAEVRRNVSRVKTDFRMVATAIESYRIDTGSIPREQNTSFYGPGDRLPNSSGMLVDVAGVMSNVLSTPVPYLTTARITDIFQDRNINPMLDEQFYSYHDIVTRSKPGFVGTGSPFWKVAPVFYGSWRMISVGPDRRFAHLPISYSAQLGYDPTNGTWSTGNIFRAALFADSKQPDPGRTYVNGSDSAILLGAH